MNKRLTDENQKLTKKTDILKSKKIFLNMNKLMDYFCVRSLVNV